MEFKTNQEVFWSGEFGDKYSCRNHVTKEMIASNTALFSRILSRTNNISSVLEFGSNVGLNLRSLYHLLPSSKLSAIEINNFAVEKLQEWGKLDNIYHQSILDFNSNGKTWDMALIKGVLIHINPDELETVYQKLYYSSNRYILIVEYYNPTPVEVKYRGHRGKLFKRDFAGEMLDQYQDLKIVDYGFVWHRDKVFPQDDATWFLLKK